MIVVLTGADDSHVAFVQRHLAEPMVRINPGDIVSGQGMTYRLVGDTFTVEINGKPLRDVSAVWYRRPTNVELHELALPEHLREYAHRAIALFGRYMEARFADSLWLPGGHAQQYAEDKTRQLELASRLGFTVPATIVSASAQDVAAFMRQHDDVITKPIGGGYYRHDNKAYGFYTSRVPQDVDLSGLHLAPAMFQQAVPAAYDIRVTVVGSQVFAAAISTTGENDIPSHVRDWRAHASLANRTITAHDLPRDIADRCIAHVRELGLRYGAIDLVLDPKGTYWFLENNPNGQWAFVELATGQPIGKAVADLLMNGNKEYK